MNSLKSGLLKAVFLSSVACISTGCANIYPLSLPMPPDTAGTMRRPLPVEDGVSDIFRVRPGTIPQTTPAPEYPQGLPVPAPRNSNRALERDFERAKQDARAQECKDRFGGFYNYRQDRCEIPRPRGRY